MRIGFKPKQMSNTNIKLTVGTRGSVLALAQSNMLLDQIKAANQGVQFVIKTIKTSGDLGLIQEIGAVVKEVENALLKGEIDLAVHSYKDMPVEQPEGLVVSCVPLRGEHRDCLVSRDNILFNDLPSGAKIGTSSLRRSFQIKNLRPDLEVVPIHGNIITRMNKVESGELDAVVLALAGLNRVGMRERASHVFSTEEFLPAVSQGALAIETRSGDLRTAGIVRSIHDSNTEIAVRAEREFLRAAGGGCRMPMAAFARIEGNNIFVDGMYCNEDGSIMEKTSVSGSTTEAERVGRKLATELLGRFK